ncbi:MAG: hypothetical protein V7609_1925 [Verrucomicrobiota bacterium]
MKHHIIISGTGRVGTTFLVQLLTALDYGTGYARSETAVTEESHAGLEKDIREPDAPYIVKSPFLCDYLHEIMASGNYTIDHALIPIRDLFSAAESRRHVSGPHPEAPPNSIPGGIWDTADPLQQEAVLMRKFYDLMQALAAWNIPFTLLHFPRLACDPHYLYAKLQPVFRDLRFESFVKSFAATTDPRLIHAYTPK